MIDDLPPATKCSDKRPGGSPPGRGDNVVPYPGMTTLDINPDKVLQSAVGELQDVILAGIDMDGNEYFASSYGSTADTLFLLERFKKMLLEARDE